ncbi:MAG: hypothetical protein LBP31_02475 [Holosporales bacterium]|jgi:hypothetical protein|nr:hypothetical protein [Holosporales bacterium]
MNFCFYKKINVLLILSLFCISNAGAENLNAVTRNADAFMTPTGSRVMSDYSVSTPPRCTPSIDNSPIKIGCPQTPQKEDRTKVFLKYSMTDNNNISIIGTPKSKRTAANYRTSPVDDFCEESEFDTSTSSEGDYSSDSDEDSSSEESYSDTSTSSEGDCTEVFSKHPTINSSGSKRVSMSTNLVCFNGTYMTVSEFNDLGIIDSCENVIVPPYGYKHVLKKNYLRADSKVDPKMTMIIKDGEDTLRKLNPHLEKYRSPTPPLKRTTKDIIDKSCNNGEQFISEEGKICVFSSKKFVHFVNVNKGKCWPAELLSQSATNRLVNRLSTSSVSTSSNRLVNRLSTSSISTSSNSSSNRLSTSSISTYQNNITPVSRTNKGDANPLTLTIDKNSGYEDK